MKIKPWFEASGFIVPIKYFSKIFIWLDDLLIYRCFRIKDLRKLFNKQHEKLTIENLVIKLFESFKLVPNDFSQINFKCFEIHLTDIEEYSKSEIMVYLNLISLMNSEIYSKFMLSHDKFQSWWNVLRSRRVRLNLTTIRLYFRLLSECLTELSLCSDCPELKSINFTYLEADTKNEDKTVKHTEKEFRQKFEIIQELNIWKEWEGY